MSKSKAELDYQREKSQRARNRRKTLARYDISPEDFARMQARQDGLCAICGEPPGGRLCVDHDHATSRIRGLLCDPCNKALGFLRDDTERLARAIDYITHHRAAHARRTDRQQLPIWD